MNADEIARLLGEQNEIEKTAADLAERVVQSNRGRALPGESARPISASVNDSPITRDELDAKLGQAKAEGETQFEKLRGDIREFRAASVGKTSFFLGLIATFGAIVAVLAYAGQWFGLGLQSHDALVAAAKEGAAQALAARH